MKTFLRIFLKISLFRSILRTFRPLTFFPPSRIINGQSAGQPRGGDPVRKVRASQSRITDNIGRG